MAECITVHNHIFSIPRTVVIVNTRLNLNIFLRDAQLYCKLLSNPEVSLPNCNCRRLKGRILRLRVPVVQYEYLPG